MKQFITHRSKIVIGLAALVFTVGFGAGVASAQNAHFVRADVSVDSAGDGECTFKVSGYGNLPTGSSVEVTCAADANACYACRNNGGNFPSDPKKQAETGTVSATGEFPVGRNGTTVNRFVGFFDDQNIDVTSRRGITPPWLPNRTIRSGSII